MSYTKVVAPFAGRIDRRLRDPGNLVGAGEFTPLAQINQIDPIYVYFTLNEADLLRVIRKTQVSPGEAEHLKIPVSLGLSGESGYPHACTLDFPRSRSHRAPVHCRCERCVTIPTESFCRVCSRGSECSW